MQPSALKIWHLFKLVGKDTSLAYVTRLILHWVHKENLRNGIVYYLYKGGFLFLVALFAPFNAI